MSSCPIPTACCSARRNSWTASCDPSLQLPIVHPCTATSQVPGGPSSAGSVQGATSGCSQCCMPSLLDQLQPRWFLPGGVRYPLSHVASPYQDTQAMPPPSLWSWVFGFCQQPPSLEYSSKVLGSRRKHLSFAHIHRPPLTPPQVLGRKLVHTDLFPKKISSREDALQAAAGQLHASRGESNVEAEPPVTLHLIVLTCNPFSSSLFSPWFKMA